MKVLLPPADHRSRYALEEMSRWTNSGFSFLPGDRRKIVFADGQDSVALEPVVELTPEEAANLLSIRFITGGQFAPQQSALSLIFHLLSGVDETDASLRDDRGRFDDSKGLLGRLGLTDTLVVDVLMEDVLALLRATWPRIGALDRRVHVDVSHDVDAPYLYAFSGVRGLAKAALGDGRRADFGMGNLRAWLGSVRGHDESDPFFVFDWLMDQSEMNGLASTFYFIAGHSGGRLDGDYDIGSPRMRRLLGRIIERGHDIGLHPSYNAFRSLDIIRAEKDRLISVAQGLHWRGSGIPVRMHYLRFDPVVTPGLLETAGFTFDSSLGFARRTGFRRGTMREFRLWDWVGDRATALLERPLMAMDASLYKPGNEGLDPVSAEARISALSDTVEASGGRISLLWHNNFFFSDGHRAAYERIIGRSVGRTLAQADS